MNLCGIKDQRYKNEGPIGTFHEEPIAANRIKNNTLRNTRTISGLLTFGAAQRVVVESNDIMAAIKEGSAYDINGKTLDPAVVKQELQLLSKYLVEIKHAASSKMEEHAEFFCDTRKEAMQQRIEEIGKISCKMLFESLRDDPVIHLMLMAKYDSGSILNGLPLELSQTIVNLRSHL